MGVFKIAQTKSERLSPWVTLVTKDVISPYQNELLTYHSFAQADYVNVLAITTTGLVPLVRQYRSAVDGYTLELPGGLSEDGEDTEETVMRELLEETGCRLKRKPILLGSYYPDPGRLENRLWGFFANDVAEIDRGAFAGEVDVEVILVTKDELLRYLLDGQIQHAGHSWLIALAMLKKLL